MFKNSHCKSHDKKQDEGPTLAPPKEGDKTILDVNPLNIRSLRYELKLSQQCALFWNHVIKLLEKTYFGPIGISNPPYRAGGAKMH